MTQKACAQPDYFQVTHKAAQRCLESAQIAESALKAQAEARRAFRDLVDPYGLFSSDQMAMIIDRWAHDPPKPKVRQEASPDVVAARAAIALAEKGADNA